MEFTAGVQGETLAWRLARSSLPVSKVAKRWPGSHLARLGRGDGTYPGGNYNPGDSLGTQWPAPNQAAHRGTL